MKINVPHGTADQLKQLTWLAGRKSTPQEWMRNVWITRYGMAATDDFVAGWTRPVDQTTFRFLDEHYALTPDASDLRKQIKNPTEQGYELELGDPEPERNLLGWCVSTGHRVRKTGQPASIDAVTFTKELNAKAKAGMKRWEVLPHLVLHVPTARRAMRQYKERAWVQFSYTPKFVYVQCPVTGIEMLMSKVHPDIDPGEVINP